MNLAATALLAIDLQNEYRPGAAWPVVGYDAVLADIHARDARDTGRADAPLIRAGDALLLDNTALDRNAAIAAAIAFVEGKAGMRS